MPGLPMALEDSGTHSLLTHTHTLSLDLLVQGAQLHCPTTVSLFSTADLSIVEAEHDELPAAETQQDLDEWDKQVEARKIQFRAPTLVAPHSYFLAYEQKKNKYIQQEDVAEVYGEQVKTSDLS